MRDETYVRLPEAVGMLLDAIEPGPCNSTPLHSGGWSPILADWLQLLPLKLDAGCLLGTILWSDAYLLGACIPGIYWY